MLRVYSHNHRPYIHPPPLTNTHILSFVAVWLTVDAWKYNDNTEPEFPIPASFIVGYIRFHKIPALSLSLSSCVCLSVVYVMYWSVYVHVHFGPWLGGWGVYLSYESSSEYPEPVSFLYFYLEVLYYLAFCGCIRVLPTRFWSQRNIATFLHSLLWM